MGLLLSGLAINKNYKNEVDVLYNILNMNVVNTEEITFKKAIDTTTELSYFDIYFSSKGTLVFLNDDLCMHSYVISESDALSFIFSENSDTYMFNYSENGKKKYKITKVEGKISGSGKKLINENNVTIDELIFQYIENLIGKSFFNIQYDEKLIRCYVSNYDWLKKEEVNKTNILEPLDIKYFNDYELLEFFEKTVQYCKINNINFYIHTTLHEPKNQKIIQNIIDLKNHIGFKENVLEIIKPKFPMDSYHLIGKFNKENFDSQTSSLLFELIKNENKNVQNINPKWKEGNENIDDNEKTTKSDVVIMIFALTIIVALVIGLIYVIISVMEFT